MKKLLVLALVALMASGALAQEENEFGLWTDGEGGYANFKMIEQYAPFNLYITLHNASVASVGGYEVGWTMPALTIQNLDMADLSAWIIGKGNIHRQIFFYIFLF